MRFDLLLGSLQRFLRPLNGFEGPALRQGRSMERGGQQREGTKREGGVGWLVGV